MKPPQLKTAKIVIKKKLSVMLVKIESNKKF